MTIKRKVRPWETLELYIKRTRLPEDRMMLVRIRVAIRIVSRWYKRMEGFVPEQEFPKWALRKLDRDAEQGITHMLDEEVRDVLLGWAKGETYGDTYARAVALSSIRMVNRVRYGGRRN